MNLKELDYIPEYIEWLKNNPEEIKKDLAIQTSFAQQWLKFYIHKRKGTIKNSYRPHQITDISRCLFLLKLITICNKSLEP